VRRYHARFWTRIRAFLFYPEEIETQITLRNGKRRHTVTEKPLWE
jgi:hypothetical protein